MTAAIRTSTELAQAIRISALEMTSRGNASHIGSVFSCADILAVLYSGLVRHWPHFQSTETDRMVMCKGHATAGLYAALAHCGAIPLEQLDTFGANDSALSGHANAHASPAVDLSTGSLGQGLGVACGMALALKKRGSAQNVFAVMSDGELDEGANWEAFMFAAHHQLGNLTAVIDYNNIQSLDTVANTLGLEPIADKLRAFGWHVTDLPGHDHAALRNALAPLPEQGTQPRVVIARTTKGKGVSFMHDQVVWHYRSAKGEDLERALAELRGVAA